MAEKLKEEVDVEELTEEELEIVEKNKDRIRKEVSDYIYHKNKDPHPLPPDSKE